MRLNISTSKIRARFANMVTRFERAWDENPVAVIGVLAMASAGAAKFLQAYTGLRNSRAWRREVTRRERMGYARYDRKG
jgi:hypothetical protein